MLRRFSTVFALIASGAAFAQTRQIEISVEGARPLAKGAGEIQRLTGLLVNYEDVRYTNAADLVEVTEIVARQPSNIRIFVPR